MKKINFNNISFSKGFTLIELLVVLAIVGVLLSVVITALSSAKNKGNDGGIKANLSNAIRQGEIFYNTNTVSPNAYSSVCTNGIVGGATGVGVMILAAAKLSGLSSYGINNVPAASTSVATCNDSISAWASEVPLKTAGQMWCVDSTGRSKQENATIGAGTACA